MAELYVGSYVNDVMISSAVSACSEGIMTEDKAMNARLLFKSDPIRAEVSAVISVFDQEVLNDILNDRMALSKLAAAVGSTT